MYTSTVLGEGKCVLFREVSLTWGVLFREVSLYHQSLSSTVAHRDHPPRYHCWYNPSHPLRHTCTCTHVHVHVYMYMCTCRSSLHSYMYMYNVHVLVLLQCGAYRDSSLLLPFSVTANGIRECSSLDCQAQCVILSHYYG